MYNGVVFNKDQTKILDSYCKEEIQKSKYEKMVLPIFNRSDRIGQEICENIVENILYDNPDLFNENNYEDLLFYVNESLNKQHNNVLNESITGHFSNWCKQNGHDKYQNITYENIVNALESIIIPNEDGEYPDKKQKDKIIDLFIKSLVSINEINDNYALLHNILNNKKPNIKIMTKKRISNSPDTFASYKEDGISFNPDNTTNSIIQKDINKSLREIIITRHESAHSLHRLPIRYDNYISEKSDNTLDNIFREINSDVNKIISKYKIDSKNKKFGHINIAIENSLSYVNKKIGYGNYSSLAEFKSYSLHNVITYLDTVISCCKNFDYNPTDFEMTVTLEEIENFRQDFYNACIPYHNLTEALMIEKNHFPMPESVCDIVYNNIGEYFDRNELFKLLTQEWDDCVKDAMMKYGKERMVFVESAIIETAIVSFGKKIVEKYSNLLEPNNKNITEQIYQAFKSEPRYENIINYEQFPFPETLSLIEDEDAQWDFTEIWKSKVKILEENYYTDVQKKKLYSNLVNKFAEELSNTAKLVSKESLFNKILSTLKQENNAIQQQNTNQKSYHPRRPSTSYRPELSIDTSEDSNSISCKCVGSNVKYKEFVEKINSEIKNLNIKGYECIISSNIQPNNIFEATAILKINIKKTTKSIIVDYDQEELVKKQIKQIIEKTMKEITRGGLVL